MWTNAGSGLQWCCFVSQFNILTHSRAQQGHGCKLGVCSLINLIWDHFGIWRRPDLLWKHVPSPLPRAWFALGLCWEQSLVWYQPAELVWVMLYMLIFGGPGKTKGLALLFTSELSCRMFVWWALLGEMPCTKSHWPGSLSPLRRTKPNTCLIVLRVICGSKQQ